MRELIVLLIIVGLSAGAVDGFRHAAWIAGWVDAALAAAVFSFMTYVSINAPLEDVFPEDNN